MSETDTTSDLNEIIHYERVEADMLQAQYEAESRALARLNAQGVCTHSCGLGYKAPAFYSADDIAAMLAQGKFGNRAGFTGGQEDIGRGNVLCTDCGEVYVDPFPEDLR